MKILVFSDSHTDVKHMAEKTAVERPDEIIHLGDHIMDAVELNIIFPNIKYHCVAGNCDFSLGHSIEQFISIGGKTFFLTHGHRYHVKSTHSLIKDKGRTLGADVILFGHTHNSLLTCQGGMYIMNPGCIGRFAHSSSSPSYGRIRIEDGEIRCDIITD